MSTILLLGGSHSDLPLIRSVIKLGFRVFTTSNDRSHPGHQIAHEVFSADYSDKEEILELARNECVDAIVPGANDFAIISASYVSECLNLGCCDTYDATVSLHQKDRFKLVAEAIGLSTPRHTTLKIESIDRRSHVVEGLDYPLIVKPVDLTGGKGITKILCNESLPEAILKARLQSREKSVVVEEWFEGDLHSYSVVIVSGRVVFEYYDSEFCLYDPFLVSTSISVAHISDVHAKAIRAETEALADTLKLRDGVLHCQFLYNGDEFRILEYTRRMSGDLYSEIVSRVRGIPHSDLFVRAALGLDLNHVINVALPATPFHMRHCVTAHTDGIFSTLQFTTQVQAFVTEIQLVRAFGTYVEGNGKIKVAVVLLNFQSEEQMRFFLRDITSHLQAKIEVLQ